jgi:hypothetical protein
MYFDTKNYLKSKHNNTAKHILTTGSWFHYTEKLLNALRRVLILDIYL